MSRAMWAQPPSNDPFRNLVPAVIRAVRVFWRPYVIYWLTKCGIMTGIVVGLLVLRCS